MPLPLCKQERQNKNGNVWVQMQQYDNKTWLIHRHRSLSPQFCLFLLASLSITSFTNQFSWKTLLMCSDKHIASKRHGLLKHMVHMLGLLEAFWLSYLLCWTHMGMQINAPLCLHSLPLILHAAAAVLPSTFGNRVGSERGEGIHFWLTMGSTAWYVSPPGAL